MSGKTIDPSDVTLIKGAIHNPDEPRHFMQIVPAAGRQTVTAGGRTIADSQAAVVVKEVGRGVYDPVVYFPRADVDMSALDRIEKTTFCPLKGDTEYFDVLTSDGERIAESAWSYIKMVAGDELFELVAFDTSKVTLSTAD